MDRPRSIFDGLFDGLWLVASDGRTIYADGVMARLLGSTQGRMRGRPIGDFLEESQQAMVDGFLFRQRHHSGERIEVRLHGEGGRDLTAIIAGSPITTHEGAYVGAMLEVSDVTGGRAIDAQVIQNQRLEAVGQFAGGIAHDFNNLLTSIRGYAELALANMPEDDPAREDLDQVLAGADRASAITSKLLAFTRRRTLAPVVVDPAQVVADLVPILWPLLGDGVELTLDIGPGHGWVRVDPTQLEQVIVNLAVNARDAMPLGGRTTISIRNVGPGDFHRPGRRLNRGPFVRISVADTGTGMDEATLARAFDPFFTTKGPGQGTGLGLSVVSGIVAQSGGCVHVKTVPGSGSTFHIDLPCVRAAGPSGPPPPVQAVSPRSGAVLLVEDDAAVRRFARRALENAGYTVLTSAAGGPALEAIERRGGMIDVLVTDIAMPGLNGLDLAAMVVQRRPGTGVVFISGDAEVTPGRAGEVREAGALVTKPFTAEALSRAVGQALDVGRAALRRDPPKVSARVRLLAPSVVSKAARGLSPE
jgi:PAS domain S-box-containing protein